jgi:hypothetical protein
LLTLLLLLLLLLLQAKSIEAAHQEKLKEAKRKRENLIKEVAALATAFADIKKAAKVLKVREVANAVIKHFK